MTAQGTIVVGVDGSDGSRAALEFALDEAARRGAAVRVVLAMPETEYWATANGMSPSVVEELSHSVEKVGREMVDDALRERAVKRPCGSTASSSRSMSRSAWWGRPGAPQRRGGPGNAGQREPSHCRDSRSIRPFAKIALGVRPLTARMAKL